jgi:hypothetical protein
LSTLSSSNAEAICAAGERATRIYQEKEPINVLVRLRDKIISWSPKDALIPKKMTTFGPKIHREQTDKYGVVIVKRESAIRSGGDG